MTVLIDEAVRFLLSVVIPTVVLNTAPIVPNVIFTVRIILRNTVPLLFQQADGTPTGMLQFGDDFIIEKQEKGEWKAASVVVEGNYGFNAIEYSIANDSTTEFKVDWEWLYGKLEPGEYRIGKSVLDFRETGDYDEYMIFGHFILESDSGKDKKSKIVAAIEDKTLSGDIATADALEKFYSDGVFDYYFSSIKSEYVVVYYSDGTEETVENALKQKISISCDFLSPP